MNENRKPRKPGSGGARPGAGRPTLPGQAGRTVTVSAKVSQAEADWLKANGGSRKVYLLIREAFNQSLIV